MNFSIHPTVNLLPGPVSRFPAVDRAFRQEPVSHRSQRFLHDFQSLRRSLTQLTRAGSVHLLSGSGSLANEVIAARLSLRKSRGLMVSCGEFGDRLIDQAQRWGLQFDTLRFPWGSAIEWQALQDHLDANHIDWLWTPHCETSSGYLIDLDRLKSLSIRYNYAICLDAVSSLGNTAVDLKGIHLASGTSGKGFGGYPGIALVFSADRGLVATDRLPAYLDIGAHQARQGLPYTLNSNLFYALQTGVELTGNEAHWKKMATLAYTLETGLATLGLSPMLPRSQRLPGVLTVALPQKQSAVELGQFLRQKGVLVSFESQYLQAHNWIQFCLMGHQHPGNGQRLLALLRRYFNRQTRWVA
ncbi:MAG: aminotransferase class V-fold PLP-dependent enzyme [Salibacteraceae bacterium]